MKETDGGYIDSVTILVTGEYAYGYLKSETGSHRLVRNSPFNAGNARHTSFSGVRVLPDIDDTIDIKIEEKDLEVYGQIGGGGPKAGGQARNKTASACRLKHFPSGIAFVVCTERSYHDNLRTAMKMLKAKLYDIEVKKKNSVKDELNNSLTDMAFGNQIRSYVMQPYTLIKDHRTDYERRDAQTVLDGDIQGFLEAMLRIATTA
jgi:peptide chain release factor 2